MDYDTVNLIQEGRGSIVSGHSDQLIAEPLTTRAMKLKSCCTEFFSGIWKGLRIVTVEPVLLLYMLATFMQYSVFQDLVYQKTCAENFNQTICQNLNNASKEALDVVQEQASHWILGSTVALTVPSIIVANYLGSWSDRFGRKWILVLPALGMIIASIVYILMSLYDSVPVSFIILASFSSGIFGGFVSCIMAVMSYISSISSEESRSLRVAMLEAMTFIGGTVGPFMGGAILSATDSHASVFAVILACYVLIVIYVIFGVPSVNVTPENDDRCLDERAGCKSYVSCNHVQQTVKTCFQKRPNNKRQNLLLLLIAALVTMTVTAGEMDIAYLYTKDDPLAWDFTEYSTYFGLKYGVGALALIALSPMARCLGLHETFLCCVGLVSKGAGLVLHGFATTSPQMYAVPFVSMLNTFCLPSIRSLLSKQVDENELGKLFAFVASVENICTLLGSLIFNSLYPLTRPVFRGFEFLLAAGLLIIPLLIIGFIGFSLRRERRAQETPLESNATTS